MKKIFLTVFTFINVILFAQTTSKLVLSNIDGFNIKISQLNDTTVRLVLPNNFMKKCYNKIFFHKGGFLQTMIMQTGDGNFRLAFLPIEIKRKLTIGSKITFGAYCILSNGKHVESPQHSSTYTIVFE